MKALRRLDPRAKLLALLAFTIACLHVRSPLALIACLCAAFAFAAVTRLGVRDVSAALRALAVILVFTAFMQILSYRQGQVLATLGPVVLTSEALGATARMMASLVAVVTANLAFMRITNARELTDAFAWALGPLRKIGVNTGGITLALIVTLRFVPVLVDDARQLKRAQQARLASFDGTVLQRLAAYTRLFAPLVRGSFRRADTLAQSLVCRCCQTTRPRRPR